MFREFIIKFFFFLERQVTLKAEAAQGTATIDDYSWRICMLCIPCVLFVQPSKQHTVSNGH